MGNDGGSIPDRRDLVRNKPKAEQADKANQTRARWFFCALSKRKLQEPIVSCALGKLYNKDALLEYLLDRSSYGDGEEICGHIRSLKDVTTLKFTRNPARTTSPSEDASEKELVQFVCPLTIKEMNGVQPFLYILTCGCVFSQAGFKAVVSSPAPTPSSSEAAPPPMELCPQCGAKYNKSTDVLTINPSPAEEADMRLAMEVRRLATKTKASKKRKAPVEDVVEAPPPKKQVGPHMNPTIAAASRAVVQSLAAEEAKRKESMSETVKSLYGSKDGPKRKETFMTMGTFTRYA